MVRSILEMVRVATQPWGTIQQNALTLFFRLNALKTQIITRMMTKKEAKHQAKLIFDQEFLTLLQLSKQEVRVQSGFVGDIPPDEMRRLVGWKNEEIQNFNTVIDAI